MARARLVFLEHSMHHLEEEKFYFPYMYYFFIDALRNNDAIQHIFQLPLEFTSYAVRICLNYLCVQSEKTCIHTTYALLSLSPSVNGKGSAFITACSTNQCNTIAHASSKWDSLLALSQQYLKIKLLRFFCFVLGGSHGQGYYHSGTSCSKLH